MGRGEVQHFVGETELGHPRRHLRAGGMDLHQENTWQSDGRHDQGAQPSERRPASMGTKDTLQT